MTLPLDTLLDIGKIFYGVLICFQMVFGSDLLIRYFKADKQTRGDAAFFAFFFIGGGVIATGAYNIVALYSYIYVRLDWLQALQVLIATVILTVLATAGESAVQWRKWFHVKALRVGIFGIGGTLAYIYAFIGTLLEYFDGDNTWVWLGYLPAFIAIVVLSGITLMGFLTLFQRIRPKRETALKIITGLAFGLFAAIGAGLRWLGRVWQNEFFLVGFIVELVGWIGFRASILTIASYSELEWRGGLIDLYLLFQDSGILLFHQNFRELSPEERQKIDEDARLVSQEPSTISPESLTSGSSRLDKDLVSSGIAGVQNLLKEITGARGGLQSVQMGNKFLISAQGEVVLAVVLADKNLGVYHDLLTRFVWDVENTFPDMRQRDGAGGANDEFDITPIAEKYFSTKISLLQKKL